MNSYYVAFLLLFSSAFWQGLESPQGFSRLASRPTQKSVKTGAANIIFQSTDGGQTWQDISQGLPENVQADEFVEKNNELYLRTGNGIYHSKPTSPAPYWQKENFPAERGNIAPGKNGIFAYNYQNGQFLKKINGTNQWLPTYTNLLERQVRNMFETSGGTVFIGSDRGLFKSTDSGKSWKHVQAGGWVIKMVESNGILLATSQSGIIRSTDDGENWDIVISEGGVGIAVERINGGFAAISYNTQSETRRVRTSYDGGKTWQPIDANLPASLLTSSIVQVGDSFFCGHPDGIFTSSDKGKTWKLVVPSTDGKVFSLSVSGNVMYAILRNGGC